MERPEELRPYLFSSAYRALGSVAEAEDVVQDAYLRYEEADVEAESPKAYLATVTTRLAIDQLRSARARREGYPGEWLAGAADRPAPLGARAPRGLSGRVAAGAARRRRGTAPCRDGRLALPHLSTSAR